MDGPEITTSQSAAATEQVALVASPDHGERLLIQRALAQTPEDRLRGLANAATFFALAHRA